MHATGLASLYVSSVVQQMRRRFWWQIWWRKRGTLGDRRGRQLYRLSYRDFVADETAGSVRGGLHYLYRAVDKQGKSVGSLLRADRGLDASWACSRKDGALRAKDFRWPRLVLVSNAERRSLLALELPL